MSPKKLILCLYFVMTALFVSAQCTDGSQPECDCGTAELLCSVTELDNFIFSMDEFAHPGPDPCGPLTIANNPTWFSFVAWCEDIEMTVEIDNCSMPSFSIGVQVAVFEDCSSNSSIVDCVNDCGNEDDKVLDLENLIIGEVYHFMIDGCAGSACDVEISVDGSCDEFIEDWTDEEIFGDVDACLDEEVDYTVNDLDGATSYHWSVDGTEIDVTSDPENTILWDAEGTYELCVDVSNQCVDIGEDPIEICETITVYNPDAGMLTAAPNPLCPGEFTDVEVTGFNDDPAYEQVLIFVDRMDEVVEVISGSSTASFTYDECGAITIYSLNFPTAEGITVPSVGESYTGSDCMELCCDETSIEISFEDTEDPVFTNPPADISFTCFADVPPMMDLDVTDNCAPDATVSGTETDDSDDCGGGTITREWEFADDCGNMVMHTQTITIDPVEEPEYINPPADVVIDCDGIIPDPIDLDYTNNGMGACLVSGSVSPIVTGSFDICGTIITYEWDFSDFCGVNINHIQTIEILPAEEVMFINPPQNIVLSCEDAVPPPMPLDYSNGDSGACLIEGSVDPVVNGSFDACGSVISYTWEFTDPCNNTIEHEQTIEIEPAEEAEFINPPPDETLDCDVFNSFTFEDLEYGNGESGACEITGFVSPVITDDTNNCGGTVEAEYEFTDDCGREIVHIQTITVDPPLQADFLSSPPDITVDCDEIPTSTPDLFYSNGESGVCLIEGSVSPVIDEDFDSCGGTITNTWEYVDDCGRVTEYSQTITVNPAPEAQFESLPGNMTMDCDEFAEFSPETLDYTNDESGNCEISGGIDPETNGDINECGGVIEYIWEFTDDCGRTIEHTQVITVNPAPEAEFINVPDDITLDCEEINEDLLFLEYDNGESGICQIQGFIEASPNGTVTECGGIITYTWTFVDECDRQITEEQTVEYLPAEEPEFDDPPEDVVVDCDEDLPDPDPLEYDNGEDSPCEISGEVDPIVDVDDNIYTYTWTYTNNCTGNTIEHVQTIEKLIPVEFEEDEYEFETCIGNEFDLSEVEVFDLNNTDPELTYHDDLPPDNGNDIDPDIELEDDFVEFYIVGTNEFGCQDIATVFIFAEDPISAGEDTEAEFCISSTLLDLYAFLEPPASLDGEFIQSSGPELDFSFADEIDVSEAEPGIYTFDYFVESENSCPDDDALMTLELVEAVEIDLISIECAIDGNSYELIITNDNYDIDISDGQITEELPDRITISNIPVEINIEIEVQDDGTGCENNYIFNSPDCACPPVSPAVSNGNARICEGEMMPTLSVMVGPDATANWYDSPTGGNLLAEATTEYTPQMTDAGLYSFFVESESLLQEDCFAPFRVEIQLQIDLLPLSVDTFLNVCNVNGTGFESFEASQLTDLISLGQNNIIFEFYRSLDDLENELNPVVFPFTNEQMGGQVLFVELSNSATCTAISSIDLRVNTAPLINVESSDVSCFGAADGNIIADIVSEAEPTSLFFENSLITPGLIDSLSPGIYTLIAEDSLMCRDTVELEIMGGQQIEFIQLNAECNDNNTGADATDDFYEITFELGANPAMMGTYKLSTNDGIDLGTFSYDEIYNIQLAADNTTLALIAEDTNTACAVTADVGLLSPCSTDCLLELVLFESECSDNSTPLDPLDDFYTISLNIEAINPGVDMEYIVLIEGTALDSFAYNTVQSIELAADGASPTIIIQDINIASCTLTIPVQELTACSDDCTLSASAFDIICNNGGTTDTNDDDLFSYSLVAEGINNAADSFTINNNPSLFGYGDTLTFPGNAVTVDSIVLILTDQMNMDCRDTLTIFSPGPCSEPCTNIISSLNISSCFDNDTPNNLGDDFVNLELIVENTEGTSNTVLISNSLEENYGPFQYGEIIIINNVPANGQDIVFEVSDSSNANCFNEFIVNEEACSEPCILELEVVDVNCNNNGTIETNADDLFDAIISVEAVNGSPGGYISNLGINNTYDTDIIISDQPISQGNILLEVTDAENSECSNTIELMAPPACSEPCEIELLNFEIFPCDNNGTPTDASDDIFSIQFEIIVSNGEFSNYILEDQEGNSYGPFEYGQLNEIEDLMADSSDYIFLHSDLENNTCTLELTANVESCSDLCVIDLEIIDVICRDNGTAETNADDLYDVIFQAAAVNGAAGYLIENNGINGVYNEQDTLEGISISDGNLILSVVDLEDNTCMQSLEIEAPEPCSSPCQLLLDVFEISPCNNNGTGDNEEDDFFEINFSVSVLDGMASTYTLESDAGTFGPFEYGAIISLGPFPANGENLDFELSDTANEVCALDFSASSGPCSICEHDLQLIAITEELNCDNQTIELNITTDTSPAEIIWTGPTGATLGNDATIDVSQAGNFTVFVLFEDNCSLESSIDITANFDTPQATATLSNPINCENPTAILDASASSLTDNSVASWLDSNGTLLSEELSFETAVAGVYSLEIIDSLSNCVSEQSITVTENLNEPSAVILANPGNILDCIIQTIELSTVPEENTVYSWIINNEELSNEIMIEVNNPAEVTLVALDTVSLCTDEEILDIQDFVEFPLIELLGIEDISCDLEDVCIQLTTASFSTNIETSWIDDQGNILEVNENEICISEAGNYTIEVIDLDNNCSNAESFSIDAPLIPEIDLAPEITVQLGEEYQLEAGLNLNLDQISSIIWNSDADLSCSDCLNPVIINYQDGDFIQLLVVSETDCEAVAETRIRVEDNKVPSVYIPNVFSPNNTVNFTIYASEQIGTIQHMYIYDRWGELMFTNENFEPNQPELGWDGTFDNKRVEQGVYVYMFIYELDGRIIREFGDITLLW